MSMRECSNCHRTVSWSWSPFRRASEPGRAALCPSCASRLESVRFVGYNLLVRPG
jgi:NAD-dependent SIR2 family protein deacetylase